MSIGIHIETFKGKGKSRPWRYRVVASNEQKELASQGYTRRWNRNRAVKKLKTLIPGIEVKPV